MKKITLLTSLLIAATAMTTGARAQNVYKCSGNTYTQMPCPEGVKLAQPKVPDRTQQQQADQATARDARTADRMEKARLRQERLDLKANTPPPDTRARTTAPRSSKVTQAEDFVAEVPGTGKSKTTKRKTPKDSRL